VSNPTDRQKLARQSLSLAKPGSRRPTSKAIWTACCFWRERNTKASLCAAHHLTPSLHARALDRKRERIGQAGRLPYLDQRPVFRGFPHQTFEWVRPSRWLQLAEAEEIAT